MPLVAVEAHGRIEAGGTMGTFSLRLESVEGLFTGAAFPIGANGWGSLATGAGESRPARQPGLAQKLPGLLKAAPANQEQVDGDEAEPDCSLPNREPNDADDADDSKNGGYHQA